MAEGVIERSIYGFPGTVSTIIDVEKLDNVEGERIIKENPSTDSLLLRVRNNSFGLNEGILWAKSQKLKVGVELHENNGHDLDFKGIDFLRIILKKRDFSIRETLGKMRANGIKHEIVYAISELCDGETFRVEETYQLCSPCDSFIVEVPRAYGGKFQKLTSLTQKYSNIILRYRKDR